MITFIIKAGVVSQSLICRTRTKDQKLGCGSLLTFHFYPFSLNIRRTFAILDQMTQKSKFNSRIRQPNRIKIQTSNPRREQGTIRWDPIRKINSPIQPHKNLKLTKNKNPNKNVTMNIRLSYEYDLRKDHSISFLYMKTNFLMKI